MDSNLKEITEIVLDKLRGWLETGIDLLPNFALALIVLIAGYFAAKFSSKYGKKYLTHVVRNKTIGNFIGKLLFIAVFVLVGVLALSVMNLDKTISSILAGLGIAGLALGFAFQDTAANLMSGVYISFKQPLALGDIIQTKDGHMGEVMDINLRVTKLKLFDGPIVFIPNKHLFQDYFINYTEPGKRRLDLDCGVTYNADLEEVERVAIKALEGIEHRSESDDVTVHWKEFGSSSINFSVHVWMKYDRKQSDYIQTRNEAIIALKKSFDKNGITIPFPIRTLDFGIEGGQRLRQELKVLQLNGS